MVGCEEIPEGDAIKNISYVRVPEMILNVERGYRSDSGCLTGKVCELEVKMQVWCVRKC